MEVLQTSNGDLKSLDSSFSDETIKDHFVNELIRQGTKVNKLRSSVLTELKLFDDDELFDFFALIADYQLVIHDSFRFASSVSGYKYDDKSSEAELSRFNAADIETTINNLFYTLRSEFCYQIKPPEEENLSYKHIMTELLGRQGVPVPHTVPASEFKRDFFPVFVKKVDGCCGNDIFYYKTKKDFVIPKTPEHYVVQEALRPPTKFSSNIRVVVYGQEVVGAMIYYNGDSVHIVNGANGCKGIPLTEEIKHPMSSKEKKIMDSYSLTKEELDGILCWSGTIGQLSQQKGLPAAAIEFILDKETRKIACIDINPNFGLGIFHVLYNNDRETTPRQELRKIAGEKLAQAYLKQLNP